MVRGPTELTLGLRELILDLTRFECHVKDFRVWSNPCRLMTVFDLPYQKLLPNNYVIFIRLFAECGAILNLLW